mgnify:CR=1 FL=1
MSKGFKSTQVFDWEHEPHDERPSEFAQSTGYQLHSGFYVAPVSTRRRSGGALVWLLAAALVGLSVLALVALARFLRG